MCKETQLSLLSNTRRDMATQNVKIKENHSLGCSAYSGLPYYLNSKSPPHLSLPLSCPPPSSLASISSGVLIGDFNGSLFVLLLLRATWLPIGSILRELVCCSLP